MSFQSDKTTEERLVIDRFVGEFAFLSNFYPSTIYVDGKQYKTVEHAYQAAKTHDALAKETIRCAPTPGEAKRLGQLVIFRDDWDNVKISIMRELIALKFENPFLRPMLAATDPAELIEGNKWNDTFWGVCRGVGHNWLGKLLMQQRKQILAQDNTNE